MIARGTFTIQAAEPVLAVRNGRSFKFGACQEQATTTRVNTFTVADLVETWYIAGKALFVFTLKANRQGWRYLMVPADRVTVSRTA